MKRETLRRQLESLLRLNARESGRRIGEVFEDWLYLVDATLRMQPMHLAHYQIFGCVAVDPPDIAALWQRYRNIYAGCFGGARPYFDRFAQCLGIIQHLTQMDHDDYLGQMYMEFEQGGWNGQFFTPFHLAQLMSGMMMRSVASEVYQHMASAIKKSKNSSIFQAILRRDDTPLHPEQERQFWLKSVPELLSSTYEPVEVYDPAVGSAGMHIAVAASVSEWMNHWGFIQYYGQDIDPICVLMARVNHLLYGLNGHKLRCMMAAGHVIIPSNVDWIYLRSLLVTHDHSDIEVTV